MKKRNMKPLLILGFIAILFLILYLALPKVYINEESIQMDVEAFEVYDPKELFDGYLDTNPKLFVKTNLGWKEQSLSDELKVEDQLIVKLLGKTSLIKSNEITFELNGVDSIPPKIIIQEEDILLEGGSNLKNHIDFQVLDYRFGEYTFELKKPDIDFVGMELGKFEYTLVAEDLSGNVTEKTVEFEVVEHIISDEEANTNDLWVNKSRRFSEDFVPEMVDIPEAYHYPYQDRDFKLREEALKNYMKMVDTLEKETDLWMFVQNSYRSFEDQTRIFNNYVAQDGLEEANRYSAMPGHSEHQSGLTMDVRTDTHNYTDFSETKQYEWVKDNAHRFGYIIRYPEDKEEITKYMPEAWHLRYVGKDIATYLYENELTFDEYKIQNKN